MLRTLSLIGSRLLVLDVILGATWVHGVAAQDHETDIVRGEHVEVRYQGIGEAYAKGIADLVDAAHQVYVDEFHADMPETINVRATVDPDAAVRLYTDGNDRVTLTLKTAAQMGPPRRTGIFHVYGFCHELGHIAMYRTLKNRRWMTNDAAEGWAHFTGSYVVDAVHEQHGEAIWPDRYDYRADGMRRLDRQLETDSPGDMAIAAGHWRRLAGLVGVANCPRLFAAWNEAPIDPADPASGLKAALLAEFPEVDRNRLIACFDEFAAHCLEKIIRADLPLETIDPSKLIGAGVELKHDDGTAETKRSMAGSGHAAFFEAPPGAWYVTRIEVYAQRYGGAVAPEIDFTISLGDSFLRPVTSWAKPYSIFARDEARWYAIELTPTRVPERFSICLDFQPTGKRGVFVFVDESTSGNSARGLPGRAFAYVTTGEWMIRVTLDSPKGSDALRDDGNAGGGEDGDSPRRH